MIGSEQVNVNVYDFPKVLQAAIWLVVFILVVLMIWILMSLYEVDKTIAEQQEATQTTQFLLE